MFAKTVLKGLHFIAGIFVTNGNFTLKNNLGKCC